MMICPNCGAQMPDGSAFCAECGAPINAHAGAQAAAVVPRQPHNAAIGQQQYQAGSYQQQTAQQYYASEQQRYQAQPVQPAPFPPQTATNRAFAMTMYVSGLIGIIFALCVRDKDNAFITHHLNNAVVIFIGAFISGLLMFILVGALTGIYLFVMAIMGIVSAYNGNVDELPLVGKIHIVK